MEKNYFKILLVAGYGTPAWVWHSTINHLTNIAGSNINISVVSYKYFNTTLYSNYDMYIFNSIACRLDIDKSKMDKTVYLLPAFKVYKPYEYFIKYKKSYKKHLGSVYEAKLQVNSRYKSVVSNDVIKAKFYVDLDIRHFDFIFKSKHTAKILKDIIDIFNK